MGEAFLLLNLKSLPGHPAIRPPPAWAHKLFMFKFVHLHLFMAEVILTASEKILLPAVKMWGRTRSLRPPKPTTAKRLSLRPREVNSRSSKVGRSANEYLVLLIMIRVSIVNLSLSVTPVTILCLNGPNPTYFSLFFSSFHKKNLSINDKSVGYTHGTRIRAAGW